MRLWALRHRCWHLPRERRTPWRAAGPEEGGRRGSREAEGGRPAQLAGGAPGAAAAGTGTRRSKKETERRAGLRVGRANPAPALSTGAGVT